MPRDQQNKEINNKHTDYEGLAYLGELPLAWAACCGNQTVYNLLIDAGASPDAQDSFGNMILHMVVVCDKLVSTFVSFKYKIFFYIENSFNNGYLDCYYITIWQIYIFLLKYIYNYNYSSYFKLLKFLFFIVCELLVYISFDFTQSLVLFFLIWFRSTLRPTRECCRDVRICMYFSHCPVAFFAEYSK